jgi:hypothetical protein
LSINNNNIEFRDETIDNKVISDTKVEDCYRPISRNEIKSTLNKIYAEEKKPVDVRSIKLRSGFALISIILGTIITASIIGFRYLTLEPNLMLIGLILILTLFPVGFLLSTKNIRKIFNSMSRFKDANSPSYRTVLPKTSFQSGLLYATLLTLILIGAQSVNFMIFSDNVDLDGGTGNDIIITDNTIKFDDVTYGEPETDVTGQYYRKVTVEINNSIRYYNKPLVLEVKSWFTGKVYDKVNVTLDNQETVKVLPIKIHEPDDSTIQTSLNKVDIGIVKTLVENYWWCENTIYISKAEGVIKETNPFDKSIEITVVIYNDRSSTLAPEAVSVIISQGILKLYRGSAKNDNILKRGESWEMKFTLDIFDEESKFEVELKIDDESRDIAEVDSS